MQLLFTKYLVCFFCILALDFSFVQFNQFLNIFGQADCHGQIDVFPL